MLTNHAFFPVHKEKGVTLIEVLVTVMILSIGLLGLAGMHFHGLKNNQSSYFRSQATILGYTILDSMRANRTSALKGDYDSNLTAAVTSDGTVAKSDLADWRNKLQSVLPSGTGSVNCIKTSAVCHVIVQWDDSVGENGSTEQFLVTTQL
jgi:type IV pilus assembly protein PilV